MTAPRDPDRLIHAFLMEGQTELADQVYDAVRANIEQKRQRVVIGPWRMPDIMNKLVPIGLGAAAVVAVLVVGTQLVGSPAGGWPTAPSRALRRADAHAAPSPPSRRRAARGRLPEGPFLVVDAGRRSRRSPLRHYPSPGWTFDPGFGVLGKGHDVDNLPEAALLLWA